LDVDEAVFVRQKVRRANERGAVQRTVKMNGQDEAAHTLYIEIRAALVPLVHLVQQIGLQ